MERADKKRLLKEGRTRFKTSAEADRSNRTKALADMRFVHEPGAQWDDTTKRERGERPCLEFNKLRVTIKRVVNDMRANRPQGKTRPVEDADIGTAETLEGLIRNIWNTSDADTAIDAAAEYQVAGGMGAWRITTKYMSDSSLDQDLAIEEIKNPFCLYADPSSQDRMKRDARYWFLTSKIAKSAFEAKYPNAKAVNFEQDDFDDADGEWEDDEAVRICEYWYQVPEQRTLYLLSNGATVDAASIDVNALASEGLEILKERTFTAHKIKMCIMSGAAILEGPTDWAGDEFPFIQVFGEQMVLDGESIWFGLVRFAKDAQRAYNYSRTAAAESIALAPQAKWWATPEQAAGHTTQWAESHKKLYPFNLYNADPKASGPPQRMGGADVPEALVQQAQIDSEDIKATTGIFDASLGNRSNETSGVAIRARQSQGEIATFNYMDNMSKGVRRTWEILVNLIPRVIDTERAVRILGADGAEKYVKVNQQVLGPDGVTMVTLNDLSRGKFDVTVTTGPSYATQRQEASEVYTQLSQANPALFGVAGDLIMKATDLPYSQEISERMKAMLPPPIQQMMQQAGKQSPEVAQAMMQADQAMQQVQQHAQMVEAAAKEAQQLSSDAQQDQAKVEKVKADIQVAAANLKVQEANLATSEAQFKQLIAEQQLALAQQAHEAGSDQNVQERQNLSADLQQALAGIQDQAAKHMEGSAALLQQAVQLVAQTGQQAVGEIANAALQPKIVRGHRVNGKFVGEVVSADGVVKTIEIDRKNGELVGTITPTIQ